ncbi:MAG: AMP-binding protein [Synechococcaceae cyanobacterium]|nr:AMP-binding protein [Synechococcaceae cyanobacterium]
MSLPLLLCEGDPAATARALEAAWGAGQVVGLAAPAERERLAAALGAQAQGKVAAGGDPLAELGAGVVVGSGGSSGARRWCLQPLAHLEGSADAAGRWLGEQGIDPAACLHLDPLPLHHVSGLLPLVRCRRWGADLRWVPPGTMRRPAELAAAVPLPVDRPVLLSLVPTQLERWMACPAGLEWLERCAVIWVGGAPLPRRTAEAARRRGLPLAPCYGATETAAMVCALPPQRFLAGAQGCGPPLADVEVRRDPASGAVEVRCRRLSPGWLEDGVLRPLPRTGDGWWRSGDAGRLAPEGLVLEGRLDGAFHSGGETVFPEQLEARLLEVALAQGLPLAAVLVVPLEEAPWGHRPVALVRPLSGADIRPLLAGLERAVASWPAPERPRRWLICEELHPGETGKWARSRWREWVLRRRGLEDPSGGVGFDRFGLGK